MVDNTASSDKIQEFTTVEEFTKAFDVIVKEGCKFIVYLTGSVDECDFATGICHSWCPDCDTARPFTTKLLEKNTTRTVLKGVVMTRDEWVGNASHPYKKHPVIKAGGVPSLILFEGRNELHRVDDLDNFKND